MQYLEKFLNIINENSEILKSEKLNFILGLSSTHIKNLKKYALENNLIEQKKNGYFLTSNGRDYIILNPLFAWCSDEFPTRPNVNLEYLKEEKISPTLSRTIRNLAKHLINGDNIKEYSLEHALLNDIENAHCLVSDISTDVLSTKRVSIQEIYEKYMQRGLTKSLISVMLLDIIVSNIEKIAIYEKAQFQLNFDTLMFDRIMAVPQNFEIQKTEMQDLEILENIAIIILERRSNNILDITKGLISKIKKLDKYTLNTENLTKKTVRFRNVIKNAKDPISLFERDIPKAFGRKELKTCDIDFLTELKSSLKELNDAEKNLIKDIKKFIFKTFSVKSKEELLKRFKSIEEYIGEKDLKVLLNSIVDINVSDELWTKRIATFIHKQRVPKDWSDEDFVDFKIKTKELAIKFFVIESIVGENFNINLSKKSVLFDNYLKLPRNEQILFLRKIINQ